MLFLHFLMSRHILLNPPLWTPWHTLTDEELIVPCHFLFRGWCWASQCSLEDWVFIAEHNLSSEHVLFSCPSLDSENNFPPHNSLNSRHVCAPLVLWYVLLCLIFFPPEYISMDYTTPDTWVLAKGQVLFFPLFWSSMQKGCQLFTEPGDGKEGVTLHLMIKWRIIYCYKLWWACSMSQVSSLM